MDPKDLARQMAAHVNEATRLGDEYAGKEMPQEIADKISAELGKSDSIKAQLENARRIQDHKSFLNDPISAPAALSDWRQAAPGEGVEQVDPQSWRSFDITTPFGTKSYRFFVPERVQRDANGKADEGKAYASAFESYLRKGDHRYLGPNDYKTLSEGVDTSGGLA